MTKHETGFGLPPALLNLGSGKDFRADAFNVDVDETWSPDAVLDLSGLDLGPDGVVVPTARFGVVRLQPGSFSQIIANDVLEHVPNLTRLMTTCLALLRVGGTFEISVPFDLSYGAWQDPTHVRAFNERSWLYYTDWFWYLGWSEARFTIDALNYVPSPIGDELRARGVPRDEIVRTPRAIDSMSVSLRKMALTPEDQAQWNHWRERRAHAAVANRVAAAPEPLPAPATGPIALAGSWTLEKERYCLWIVSPKDYSHAHVFDDVALALSAAFAERGGSAPVVRHPSEWSGRIPIVLAPHLLSANMSLIVPPGSILFNMEQVDRGSVWMSGAYLALLKRFAVLDHSQRNRDALEQMGVSHARHLALGFAAPLSRIVPAETQDIDVLFYGSLNERRRAVLDGLAARGLNVVHLFDAYGETRDGAIARAKVVLNMHFYDAAIFESLRVTHLMANRACVVSEGNANDPDVQDLADGIALCNYDELIERCVALVADDAGRVELSSRGLQRISARSQAELLGGLFVPAPLDASALEAL